jgi:hypothetical protein
MATEITRIVTFSSTAFNTTEPKAYFINPGCFGDDVCNWLRDELRRRGITADEPGPEDFGWYLNFQFGQTPHCFVIAYRPGPDAATWIGWMERESGLLGSIFGARKRGIDRAAIETVHAILSGSQLIQDVRWHFSSDFDRGFEERAVDVPSVRF